MRSVSTLATVLIVGAGVSLVPTTAQAGPPAHLCRGHRATIVGTPGDEVLRGTARRDVIAARGGADRILGLGGNDLICAGPGADVVHAGGGNDVVLAGRGPDVVTGNQGDDRVSAGPRLEQGTDVLVADAGNDVLRGHPRSALVSFARAGKGGVVVDLARGHASGPGVGRDRLVGIRKVAGSAAADVLQGTSRADLLLDRGGDDWVFGRGGADVIFGRAGSDVLRGGAGRDLVVSTLRDDVAGGSGGDVVLASGGAVVRGDGGRDVLLGIGGAPVLDGGRGRDAVGLRAAGGPTRVDLRRGVADSRRTHAELRRLERVVRGPRMAQALRRAVERAERRGAVLHHAGPADARLHRLVRWATRR